MAEYAGSIDDEVQRKVDAYRSNPGALKQRYQMNQDLLDLLALQRINKEMQQKKRDIEMSIQQNPQTIKQQREAEVLGMTKDDLGRQVGGIMAQRQAAQQQNLQRVASGQRPATRMPMNPQMAGIASQPAPNMARMAQGGVVTFAEGDPVVSDALLERMGLTRDQWNNVLSDDAKAKYLSRFEPIPEDASKFRRDLVDIGDVFRRPAAQTAAEREARGKFGGAQQIGAYFSPASEAEAVYADLERRRTAADQIQNLSTAPTSAPASTVEATTLSNTGAGGTTAPAGQTGLGGSSLLNLPPRRDVVPDYLKPEPAPVAPNMQALQRQVGARPGLASRDITPTDAAGLAALRKQIDAQRQATLDRDKPAEMRQAGELSREIAGQKGVMDLLKGAQDRRAALVKEQEAARGPWDWTARLPGGGGFGDINRAMSSQRAANEAAALGNLDQEIKLIQGQATELGLFGRDASASARVAGSDVEAAQKQAAESLAMQYGVDSKAADARADRIFSASVAELESYDKAVRRVTDIALAQYEGEYAERAKKIGASASLLAAEIAAESDEKTRRAMALVNIAKLQAEVRSNAEANIANLPLADPNFQKLSPEDKANKIKAIRDAAGREAEGYRQVIEAAFAARPALPIRQETFGE
jgi:hypothetical protein